MKKYRNKYATTVLCSVLICLNVSVVESKDWVAYRLETNRNTHLCRHMNKVFNRFFSADTLDEIHSYDILKTFPNAKDVLGDDMLKSGMSGTLHDMNYTFYPDSIEFKNVKWRLGRYRVTINRPSFYSEYNPFLYSYTDIDNDGRDELIIKVSFRTDYKGTENLYIQSRDFNISDPALSSTELAQGEKGMRPKIIYGGSILRVFIFDGKTYLVNFFIENYGYPDEILVEKYLDGGVRWSDEQTPLKKNRVCSYVPERN